MAELKDYSKGSDTTGTQWTTLWFAVREILKHRPACILECGTGASTIVLASAVKKLKAEDPSYDGHIVSMESVKEWYDTAQGCLPEKYRDVVEIVLGPREKYEIGMFRGYLHGNIPRKSYDFVFLDGPSFADEKGSAFCADVLRVLEFTEAPVVRGVIDGRTSSGFVLQTMFGVPAARYFLPNMAGVFEIETAALRSDHTSTDFGSTVMGRLYLKHRSRR
ncbi:class I SAM-dependent methyltransferase [Marimonas lutisalis]|uniref:class I SAM-dependent methyltransferase n=1 Tax=Marimonas lutisalis TaxID=2545756 RepID=UPI0010F5BB6F|nr:class I SAM-dependent methyltransferase [Marimonas lutisalis]